MGYIVTVWLKKGGHSQTYGIFDLLSQAKAAYSSFKDHGNTYQVSLSKVVEHHQNK
jgi:hypothetical protein